MAIILLPSGSIYQFTDAETGVYQFAGTHEAFTKTILNNLTTTSSATVTLNGLFNNSAAVRHEYLQVVPTTNPTTSLQSTTDFLVSGSFISSNGSANHMIRLGTGAQIDNYTINYIKSSNSSNLVMIRATIGINGQTQWSSSDAWASIQAVYSLAGAEWIITSKVGNWY